MNLRGAFIRFILCDVNLSSEVCFDNMALGLLSVDRPDFFRNFIKISQLLSHFGVFITNKEEGIPHCSQNLTKEQNLTITPSGVHAQGTIMLCLYYYVFVMSYYIFKMFLLAMFGKLAIVFLESSVWFKTAMGLKSL